MSARNAPSMHRTPINMKLSLQSTMKALSAGCALLLSGAAAQAQALQNYTNFDNFDGATEISEARWLGMERHRMIEGGMLRMIQRDLGSQTGNSGVFSNSFGTTLMTSLAVTQMKGVITVNAFEASHCAASGEVGFVQARLAGAFFNAGPGVPSASNRVNDVGAVIRLRRDSNSADPANVLRVQGTVFQCTTADCNYGTISLGDVDLGTALIGAPVTLRMEWDQPNKRFNFYRDADPVKRVTYSVSDSLAPGQGSKSIGTRTTIANCMAGRTTGFMDAKFDNIYVNASAAP